ncbi:MAG: hypothetical protein ACTSPU_00040 [Promethearchaeota archaeon]
MYNGKFANRLLIIALSAAADIVEFSTNFSWTLDIILATRTPIGNTINALIGKNAGCWCIWNPITAKNINIPIITIKVILLNAGYKLDVVFAAIAEAVASSCIGEALANSVKITLPIYITRTNANITPIMVNNPNILPRLFIIQLFLPFKMLKVVFKSFIMEKATTVNNR